MFAVVIVTMNVLSGFTQNIDSCINSMQVCLETAMFLPSGVGVGSLGPDIDCLGSTPNPKWYCFQVQQAGRINITISSAPQNDLDFACWGPFIADSLDSFHNAGYCSQLKIDDTTPSHGISSGINSTDLGGYPVGNLVDCSFTMQPVEYVHIPNVSAGEWYLILVTNYANLPSVVTMVNDTSSVGVSNCDLTPPFLSLNVDTLIIESYNGCNVHYSKSYLLSGNYLTNAPDSILVSAPQDYEISLFSQTGFTDSIYVPYNCTLLQQTPIYVRLKYGLEIGAYESEQIIQSGGGANPIVLICNGLILNDNKIKENNEFLGVIISPNPASDALNCTFKTPKNRRLSIVDIAGKTIASWESNLPKEIIDIKAYERMQTGFIS